MKKLIFIVLTAVMMTGCSEMRIMTTAAFKEMNTDVVNLEQERYRQHENGPQRVEVVAQAGAEKK